ncbi:hypothetical protein RIR_jg20051.t1 [Rhizophagus irregularis DAOM 181602=DAOM 197198]|nr:hypothetical protein RIR_jg20051.t1 [Rhizophagus irregularis DAOM 181602=DAOM 197198]
MFTTKLRNVEKDQTVYLREQIIHRNRGPSLNVEVLNLTFHCTINAFLSLTRTVNLNENDHGKLDDKHDEAIERYKCVLENNIIGFTG